MSNNPFLKSKTDMKSNNNRFQFLDNDEENNKSIKKEKKEKKIISEYNSSNNSFIKQSNVTNNQKDIDRGYRTYNKKENKHNLNHKINENEPIKTTEFTIEKELFPELFPELSTKKHYKSENEVIETPSINFKDILTNKDKGNLSAKNKPTKNVVKTGCVEISYSKTYNKIVYNHGPPSSYIIKMQQQHDDPNYSMNKAINLMLYNYESYKHYYDFFNGEGAYDEKFFVPPVYGSDYDDDEEDNVVSDREYDYEDDEY